MSFVLVIKDSGNPGAPDSRIKSVYGAEYSYIEIPSTVTPGSVCSVTITVKNTGAEIK